jgi:hypothetical protein
MSKKRVYYQVTDGEWVSVSKRGFREQCCDCGLIHEVTYRFDNGTIYFKATVDRRATAAVRRKFKFEKDE